MGNNGIYSVAISKSWYWNIPWVRQSVVLTQVLHQNEVWTFHREFEDRVRTKIPLKKYDVQISMKTLTNIIAYFNG